MNKQIYKLLFTITFVLISASSIAQEYWYKASIKDSIPENGYYNIELNPELIAVSKKKDFGDLRILDKNKKEIPYFVRSDNPIKEINRFEPYQIKEISTKDSISTLIVDNSTKEELNRFYIIIRSADTRKYIQVRGSDNLSQWYIVKQQGQISSYTKDNEKKEVLIADFPKGNYKYYEIRLTNDSNSPIEIENIGTFKNSNILGQLSEIDLGRISVKDSTDKRTYISFPDTHYKYKACKLVFSISNKLVYLREGEIVNNNMSSIYFNLSSKVGNTIFSDNIIIGKETRIVINNQDNPSLQIDSIKAYGNNIYLCAYLDKNKDYSIVIGSNDYPDYPQYDLGYFSKDIPEYLPIVKTSLPTKIEKEIITPEIRTQYWFEKPVFLWSSIILVGLFLIFICYRTVKEMGKKK